MMIIKIVILRELFFSDSDGSKDKENKEIKGNSIKDATIASQSL